MTSSWPGGLMLHGRDREQNRPRGGRRQWFDNWFTDTDLGGFDLPPYGSGNREGTRYRPQRSRAIRLRWDDRPSSLRSRVVVKPKGPATSADGMVGLWRNWV